VSQWSLTLLERRADSLSDYSRQATAIIASYPPSVKILVFVPTLEMAQRLSASFVDRAVGIIYSGNKDIDPRWRVVISTNVADAGLTVDGAEVVLTPDVDIVVSPSMKDIEYTASGLPKAGSTIPPRIYYKRLSAATLRQRAGRTGRTNDGVVFTFLMGTAVEPVEYNLMDYVSATAPSSFVSYRFFPPHILAQISPPLLQGLKLWDRVPSMTWTSFQNLIRAYQQVIPLNPATGRKTITFSMFLADKKFENVATYLPRDPDVTPFEDPETEKQVPEGPAFPNVVPYRVDVPGDGLLCGAHCVRGLLHSWTDLRPSLELVTRTIRDFNLENGIPDLEFFGADTLIHAAYSYWGLPIAVHGPDGEILPHQQLPFGIPLEERRIVYLNEAHYNYLGYAAAGADNDGFASDFLVQRGFLAFA